MQYASRMNLTFIQLSHIFVNWIPLSVIARMCTHMVIVQMHILSSDMMYRTLYAIVLCLVVFILHNMQSYTQNIKHTPTLVYNLVRQFILS